MLTAEPRMCRTFGCEQTFDAAGAAEGDVRWCDNDGHRHAQVA